MISSDMTQISQTIQTNSIENQRNQLYKEAQRQSWDSVATGWQKWWKTSEKDVSGRLR